MFTADATIYLSRNDKSVSYTLVLVTFVPPSSSVSPVPLLPEPDGNDTDNPLSNLFFIDFIILAMDVSSLPVIFDKSN